MRETETNKAFTLIELLVVIAIIGVLSSVVLASLSGARESAKVTKMVSDFQQIETSLVMWMDGEGKIEWPSEISDSEVSSGTRLSKFVQNNNLNEYLNSIPTPPLGGDWYVYDNDNDVSGNCGTTVKGVNIRVMLGSQDISKEINTIIDGDNETNPLECGKIRSNGTYLFYHVSNDQTL